MSRTPLFAANWKMNKLQAEVPEFVHRFVGLLGDVPGAIGRDYEVVIAPAAVHLPSLLTLLSGKKVHAAAQNCGGARFGAFTGEISPAMLKDLGCGWTLVGHSERRHVFKEDDAIVASRLKAAQEEGLTVILCVGERIEERRAGKTFETIEKQLGILAGFGGWARLVIAYEPVWAIGTGENATPGQAQEVHAFLRKWVAGQASAEIASSLRLLYGGSVKAENSASLCAQADIDGLLVGGASLDPVSFAGIIRNGLGES